MMIAGILQNVAETVLLEFLGQTVILGGTYWTGATVVSIFSLGRMGVDPFRRIIKRSQDTLSQRLLTRKEGSKTIVTALGAICFGSAIWLLLIVVLVTTA